MDLASLKALIDLLRESGVTRYKYDSIELEMTIKEPAPIAIDAPAPVPDQIKHKVEEMTSLLKLSDIELVDQLFPDHRNDPDSEAV